MTARLEDWLADSAAGLLPSGTSFVGMSELGKALVLSAAAQRTTRPILAVFASKLEAHDTIEHFNFFTGKKYADRVHYLPSGDFDFYRGLLPNPEVLCERNVGLFHALNDPNGRIFVVPLATILHKLVPSQEFLRATKWICPNDEIERDGFLQSLVEAGYQRQPTAYDPGVFAVRGGVIDIFCPLYETPFRIEFFGDLVDEVRFFDPKTQLSKEKIEKAFVVPVGQTLLPQGTDFQEAAQRVKERLDELGIPKARRDEILEKILDGKISNELGLLFPLLSRGSVGLLDYFPKDTLFFWDGRERLLDLAREIELAKLYKSHELYEKQPEPIASRDSLFSTVDELSEVVKRTEGYAFETFASGGDAERTLDNAEIGQRPDDTQKRGQLPLETYSRQIKDWSDQGYRVHLVCHTRTHAERVGMLFGPYGVSVEPQPEGEAALPTALSSDFRKLSVWQGYLNESRVFPGLRCVFLSEEAIFGKKKRVAKSANWSQSDPARLLSSFRDLKVGDLVVHKEQGIGRYLGLKSMDFLGTPNDYVLLEYKDGDKLYIPIYRLNILQKFVSSEAGSAAALDKLGGDRWAKAKAKARRAVAELAAEFLKVHAMRRMLPAHACSAIGSDYGRFEMEFPFDETPDQLRSIGDVNDDLSHPHPMDRLVCGDVGYGKTEVAMRAAYRVVIDGKQAAVLVPTTVLAFQHFESFKQRFKNTGARIEMVSRLKSNAEIKKTLADVKEGKVDVLIGTHRLLSADVVFKDLGIVIVDEEHRFGVVHKEKLKKLCETVHYLSMTATPIPRTLNMAMAGIKEISVISTPPPDRLSVRTFVCRSSPEIIVEAITNELARNGQVFFVHNRIETIFKLAEELKALLPKVSFDVAHGQMDGETLEEKMLGFFRGDYQVLLSTAIIESGLDVPNANTIIIDRADHFGLAQLYQLRGRVGRAAKRAYCYLLAPPENELTPDAKERLQVIQRYTDLGSGFQVASHDLEIRGAGDLLGRDQSGHLNAVGVDMYFQLLEESILSLKGQEQEPDIEPEINLKIAAHFPEDYLPDIGERVLLYRRLSDVASEEAVSVIEQEIRDRFGTPPEPVLNLLGLMILKLYLKKLHVLRMSCGPKKTSLQFAESTPASPKALVKLIQSNKYRYTLTPDQKLVFGVEDPTWKGQLKEIRHLCGELGIET